MELETCLKPATICSYGILGSEDMILYLTYLDSYKFFSLYGTGGLITHSHELYKNALFNIHTQILFS